MTLSGEKIMADTPKNPEAVAKTNRRFWLGGFFLAGIVLIIGLLIPSLPYAGPIALGLITIGGSGVFGIAIAAFGVFLLPIIIKSLFGAKEGAKKGSEILKGFVKAILITAVTTLASYFLLPILLTYLSGFSSLSFLSSLAGGGHGVMSIIMTVGSALVTFLTTLFKSPGGAHIKENWKKAIEMMVGVGLGGVTAAAALGFITLPFHLPLAVSLLAGGVAVIAVFGFFSDMLTGAKSTAKPVLETGADNVAKGAVELPAQQKAAPAATAASAKEGNDASATTNSRSQPGWTNGGSSAPADPAAPSI
jgi:hypothetical protein